MRLDPTPPDPDAEYESPLWQGVGSATSLCDYPEPREVPKKKPIGFLWPDDPPPSVPLTS